MEEEVPTPEQIHTPYLIYYDKVIAWRCLATQLALHICEAAIYCILRVFHFCGFLKLLLSLTLSLLSPPPPPFPYPFSAPSLIPFLPLLLPFLPLLPSSYSIMQQCWTSEPEDRPSFSSLVSDITTDLTSLSNYLTLGEDFETSTTSANHHDNELHQRSGSVRYVRDPTLTRGQRPASYFGGSNYSGSYVDVTIEDFDNHHGNGPTNSDSEDSETGSLSNQRFSIT